MPGKRSLSNLPIPASANYNRDDGDAFFPDPYDGPALAPDDWAEGLAEGFLSSAISGHGQGAESYDRIVDEEQGGPFLITSPRKQFSNDAPGFEDESPEAFPTSSASPLDDESEDDPNHD